jgi:flagellar basal-body rod protein FlgF
VVDRIKLVKPPTSELIKGEDGLLRSRSNNPVPASAEVGVTKGILEGSNVSSVNSLVTMIDLARRYEFQVKLMENAQQNDQSATSLLRTF